MKSIAQLASVHSFKATLKILGLFSGVLFLAFGIFLACEVSTNLNSVFRSIHQNLSQSVQVGDGFQIRKLLGSLTESGTVATAIVSDSTGEVIVNSGNTAPEGTLLSIKNGKIIFSKKYPLIGADQTNLGNLILQKPLSLMPFFYLLILTGILAIILLPLIRNEVAAFAQRLIRPIEALPGKLFSASSTEFGNDYHDGIDELDQVYRRLDDLKRKESELLLVQDDIKQKEKLLWLSSQVAHDIRSPLSTLQVLLGEVGGVDTKKKNLIQHALRRMDDISQDLLSGDFIRAVADGAGKSFEIISNTSSKMSTKGIVSALELLIEEKKTAIGKDKFIEFHLEYTNNSDDFVVSGDLSQLQRIVSNLISNSIEAVTQQGSIWVDVAAQKSGLELIVRDTGKGISEDFLAKLGTTPLSFSGAKGHGLGVFHAFKTIESYGGTVTIKSEINVETAVTLRLPIHVQSAGIKSVLNKYVLIDDDVMIRDTWEISATSHGIDFVSFPDYNSFINDGSAILEKQALVFIDENLGDGISGSLLIPKIRNLGFKNVFLASGSHIANSDSGTHGKMPPWLFIPPFEANDSYDGDAHRRIVS